MSFGDFVTAALFAEMLRDHVCITPSNLERCKSPDQGEMRGKLLTHVQEQTHLGKYTGWIAAKIAKAETVRDSFFRLQGKLESGEFSQTMPIVLKDGTYSVIDTKEWLAKEKKNAFAAAVAKQQWAHFQKALDETATAGCNAARVLGRVNLKPCASEFDKQEIEDSIRAVSSRSLADFKKGIQTLKSMQENPMIGIHGCELHPHFNLMDMVVYTDQAMAAVEKVRKKIGKTVEHFEKCVTLFERCIQGMKALPVPPRNV